MASVSWPSKFPNPTTKFSGAEFSSTIRTKMESGRTRQRPRFTTGFRSLTVSWEMKNDTYEAFQAWVKYKIHNGADWFNISLPLGGGTQGFKTVEARIVEGKYTSQHNNVLNWTVSATLEVEEPKLMSEASLDSYLNS